MQSVSKRRNFGNKNETTYAIVTFLNWDGTLVPTAAEHNEILAYDIVDFWEDYEGEFYDNIESVKNRKAREAEDRQKASELKKKIHDGLTAKGLNSQGLSFSYEGTSVTIHKNELIRWLGIEVESEQPSIR